MDPCKDAFPTGMEVLKEGDPGLSAEYKALSKTLFGKVSPYKTEVVPKGQKGEEKKVTESFREGRGRGRHGQTHRRPQGGHQEGGARRPRYKQQVFAQFKVDHIQQEKSIHLSTGNLRYNKLI